MGSDFRRVRGAFILLLVCGALFFAGFFMARMRDKIAGERIPEVQRAYETVVSRDIEANYPASPEGALSHYHDTTLLLYEPSITDTGQLQKLISSQRTVYSRDMLSAEDDSGQLAALINSRRILAKRRLTIEGFSQYPAKYGPPDGYASVNAIISLNDGSSLYFTYYFQNDENGRWKLFTRESVDADFRKAP